MTPRAGASRALALAAAKLAAASIAAALTVSSACAQDSPPPSPSEASSVDVRAQVEALGGADDAARSKALERLSEVAARRPQDLEPFLAHADPDVRFQLLFLLSARDARTEQCVRQIVEGRPAFAATFPEALAARTTLLDDALREARDHGTPRRSFDLLVRLARRRAGAGDLGTRYTLVALDLAAELLAQSDVQGDAARDAAATLATLLEIDLGEGMYELCACFMALPPEAAHAALRSMIGGGSPLARARAARVLGEIVGPGRADQAAAAVRPLLGHEQPEVRLAALRALSVMPLGDDALVHAGVLANDPDAGVAEEALRLAGSRRLGFVREAAQRVALDPNATLHLRRQAVRTLGLLGNPGAAATLTAVLRGAGDRDLQVLAAWALGAVRAPDALEALLGLLERQEFSDDDRIFAGLARLGPRGVDALRGMLASGAGTGRARRIRAIEALGRATADDEGRGPREAVDVLFGLTELPVAQNLGDAGTVTDNELEHAIRALADLAPRCEEARSAIARLVVQHRHPRLVGATLSAVAEVGPPLDPTLATSLRDHLGRLLQGPVNGQLRPAVATALLRVDAVHARELLTRIVGVPGRGGQSEELLDLMRVLARAGDPGPVKQICLPLARAQLGDGGRNDRLRDARLVDQNQLGIELLYAGEWDEAILEFERMLWCRPTDETAPYNVACGHSLAGRVDLALLALRRSVRQGYRNVQHMAADADLDGLRTDIRFQRLMDRLRLEDETELRVTNDGWPRRLVPE